MLRWVLHLLCDHRLAFMTGWYNILFPLLSVQNCSLPFSISYSWQRDKHFSFSITNWASSRELGIPPESVMLWICEEGAMGLILVLVWLLLPRFILCGRAALLSAIIGEKKTPTTTRNSEFKIHLDFEYLVTIFCMFFLSYFNWTISLVFSYLYINPVPKASHMLIVGT